MMFRTRYQRTQAACDLLRDLNIRATHSVTKEITELAIELLSAPPEYRRAREPRVVELLAAAEDRRRRLGLPAMVDRLTASRKEVIDA
jgi:hypothetical protein